MRIILSVRHPTRQRECISASTFDLHQPTSRLGRRILYTLQTPPVFSAVKIKGKSAFEYARRGEVVEIKPKEISIYSLEILRFALPEIDFEICCSKGTYIRSLVRDIGEKLGCGAYLKSLQRTAIGDFKLKDALDITPLLSEFKPVNPERKKKRFEL